MFLGFFKYRKLLVQIYFPPNFEIRYSPSYKATLTEDYPSYKATLTEDYPSYKATLTENYPPYQARFHIY